MQHAILEFLLNAGWQLVLVAGCAFVAARLLMPPPGRGYWLWLAAFALGALAPWTALISLVPGPAAHAPAWLSGRGVVIAPWTGFALATGFWLCLAFGLIRLVVGGVMARRLVASSTPLELPADLRETLEAFCRQHARSLPPIRCCARISSPVVTGARAPQILVPPGLMDKSPDEVRAALLHELAHVVRGDYAVNIVVELFALPLSWHPALHAIKAMVRLTREQSCDAIAAAEIGCRHRYAHSLLSLARQAIAPAAGQGAFLAMFGDGDLQSRIALLTAASRRPRLRRLSAVAAAIAFMLLGAALTSVHLLPVTAQDIAMAQRPVRPAGLVRMAAVTPVAPTPISHPIRKHRSHPRAVDVRAAQLQPPAFPYNLTPLFHGAVSDPGGDSTEGAYGLTAPFLAFKYRTMQK